MEEIIMETNVKNLINKTKKGNRVLFRKGSRGAGFIAGKERENGGFFGMYYLEFFKAPERFGDLMVISHKVTYTHYVAFYEGIVEHMVAHGLDIEKYDEEMAYN